MTSSRAEYERYSTTTWSGLPAGLPCACHGGWSAPGGLPPPTRRSLGFAPSGRVPCLVLYPQCCATAHVRLLRRISLCFRDRAACLVPNGDEHSMPLAARVSLYRRGPLLGFLRLAWDRWSLARASQKHAVHGGVWGLMLEGFAHPAPATTRQASSRLLARTARMTYLGTHNQVSASSVVAQLCRLGVCC